MPIAVAPTFVWFAFVPTQLEFNAAVIQIKFMFRPGWMRSWDDLTCWRRGSGVFLLQFSDEQAFQIFASF